MMAARTIGGQTLLDHVLFNDARVFHWQEDDRRRTALILIREALEHHFKASTTYRRFCEGEGFAPDQLRSWADLARVPLVSSSVFKRRLLHSCPPEAIVKLCLSSGTQGSQSRVPRDNATLERFIGSTQTVADLLLGAADQGRVFNLGPDTDDAKDLWFAYVMSILELLYPSGHYVRQDVFHPAELLADLRDLSKSVRPLLVGPPVLFLHLLEHMEREEITLDLARSEATVITAGGWKRFSDESISAGDLRERLVRRLGLPGPEQVRDAFNMVELNTVVLECEHHRKHLPPWLVVMARDPGSLAVLSDGTVGLLSFLDPTASSYPAFILSDDFGKTFTGSCPCGRSGPWLEIARRVKRIEARGCALRMDKSIAVDGRPPHRRQ